MKTLLSDFEWIIKTDVINDVLITDYCEIVEFSSGMEATVYSIQTNKSNVEFVLKLWNKRVPADVRSQYYILEKLNDIGLSVSKPYALGRTIHGEYGMITSYDGMPLAFESIGTGDMKVLANILVSIHTTKTLPLKDYTPKYDDFLRYFFSLNEEHSDIAKLLKDITSDISIRTDCIIHGDYNLGNVLVNDDKYTVIDWTNVQFGDNRYDLAWAAFLILIYNGDECHREFCNTYTQQIPIDSKDIYTFEMIACLRWIWLSRIAPIPMLKDTISRVKRFIENHIELQTLAIVGYS